ncbi:hypothetical protein CapIbe_015920 [Capra ibex]
MDRRGDALGRKLNRGRVWFHIPRRDDSCRQRLGGPEALRLLGGTALAQHSCSTARFQGAEVKKHGSRERALQQCLVCNWLRITATMLPTMYQDSPMHDLIHLFNHPWKDK